MREIVRCVVVCSVVLIGQLLAGDVIGYLPNYRVNPEVMTNVKQCSDVVYFGSEMNAEGGIVIPANAKEHLTLLGGVCKAEGVRLHLCLGGWGKDKHFPVVTASVEKRAKFLKELKAIVKQYQLQGVDYDWEYPRTEEEMKNFVLLIRETKRELGAKFMVTAAFHPSHKIPKELADALDRVHLMTYDMGGKHCDISHAEKAVTAWKKNGVKPSKICLGVAFYARKLSDRNKVKTYAQMVQDYVPKVATEMPQDDYFGDNESSCRAKAELVRKEKIRGLIIWELGQDAAGEQSLMQSLHSN